VMKAAAAVQTELLMVTPYYIPADEEVQVLKELRQREVRVRVLTNSLDSAPTLAAHSGYMHYRAPLLEDGVELYEIRALLGSTKGSGQTAKLSRYGNYGLHAKLFVFDRRSLFIGSMNFDQRSQRLNTEIGLIIDSPELAQQTALRFETMIKPVNSYVLALRPPSVGAPPRLVWDTQEDGNAVEYTREPARSDWQRVKLKLLSLFPLDGEL
jgi:putative cardiolipin synthase